MLIYLALLAMVMGAIAAALLYRRKMYHDLKWPRNLGHIQFRTRVQRYFMYRGWQAEENWNGIDYLVSRNSSAFALRCHVAGDDLLMRTASDLLSRSMTSPKALALKAMPLLLCAREVSPYLTEQALDQNVYVIPLRRLEAFTTLRTLSAESVRNFVMEDVTNAAAASSVAPQVQPRGPGLFDISKQGQS